MPGRGRELEDQIARLCVYDIDSGERRVVYETADAVIEAPNWTPDGSCLVYNAEGLIYRIAEDGAGAPELVDTGSIQDANNDHVLSPDGSFLYVSSGDGHLYEIPLTGAGSPRRVSNVHDGPFRYYLHGISPDGATLAYTGMEPSRLDLFTIPVAGGPDRQLTDSTKPSDGPEFSPDGAWIYFNSEMASSIPGHSQLFRMRPDGTEPTQLTDDERVNWFPHLSPDGARLVYLSYPPGTVSHPANKHVILRSIPPDGGTPRDLLHLFGGQGTINVNSWAPDSRQFGYVEYPKV